MRIILALLCFVVVSAYAEDRPAPSWIVDDYSPASQASERIPPACVLGIVNQRFQWMPGPFDIIEHYWEKYRVDEWMRKNAIPMMEKYIPILAKWGENGEKIRNIIIIATPAVLKILHKI